MLTLQPIGIGFPGTSGEPVHQLQGLGIVSAAVQKRPSHTVHFGLAVKAPLATSPIIRVFCVPSAMSLILVLMFTPNAPRSRSGRAMAPPMPGVLPAS